jgi:drug/metabolite transporter (DMT)-like permease
MVAAVFIFAIMDALMKRLSSHYEPVQISFLRCVSSLAFLSVPIAWNRSWHALRPAMPALHLLRAALGIAMLGSFVFAVHRLSLAETYAIVLCAPLIMTALSGPVLGDRTPPRRWAAIAMGLCGVLVVLRPGHAGFGSKIAVLVALGSALCYAASALTTRFLGRRNTNTAMVFWWLVLGAIGSCFLAVPAWRPIIAEDWVWLAGIGLSGALGQFWITDAFRRAPPSVVAPFEYMAVLWGFAIDWVFWSASPSQPLVIGAAIIIASGIFIIWDERRLAEMAFAPASPPP